MAQTPTRREALRRLALAATPSPLLAWPGLASAQQGIRHTLWVVDRVGPGHLIGNQVQTILGTMGVLNLAFMAPLVTNPLADRISAQLSPAPNFVPGDAIVVLVANAPENVPSNVLGKSHFSAGQPSSAGVVYWGRCFNDLEVAGAIFHEAAHGMSQMDNEMHSYRSARVGGAGARVLAAYQPGVAHFPSHADLEFYTSAIGRRTNFVPAP